MKPNGKPDSKSKETNIKWNEIHTTVSEGAKCNHYFEFIGGECRCKGCRMGLMGVVSIVNGKPQ